MTQDILTLLPAHIHPLTLVSDPDRLLAGETVMMELAQRGFQVLQENDPVLLRRRLEELRPFTPEHPLLVITSGALEDLPYDLYQPAYRLSLSLHQYFPNLSYPILQTLRPDQVEKLAACTPPGETLSRQKTIDYLLREIFDADPVSLNQPHALIAWLSNYHHDPSPLPDILREGLLERLKHYPVYLDWEIDPLIRDSQAFSDFIQQQWQVSVIQTRSGKAIQETGAGYHLAFDRDPRLQDLLPALIRQGALQPLEMPDKVDIPAWAHPGITLIDPRLQRFSFLLGGFENRLRSMQSDPQTHLGWNAWNGFARDWAELCSYPLQIDLEINQTQKENFHKLVRGVDKIFSAWLKDNYTPLGAQRLPRPHQVHHIPHYLAYLRSLSRLERVVLIVLDGLSLADWQVIKPAWAKRNPNWEINTDVLLAQVPTITSISRNALVSGLRPADFADDLDHCAPETRLWQLFWSREGVAETACRLLSLAFDRGMDQLPELQDPQINFWCLIEDTLDKLAHNATLGSSDQQASLRLWLDPAHDQNSIPLENLINAYLDRGYAVFIASDHGHVEATGIGQPSEGLLAQTRGKRARLYQDQLAALRVQNAFSNTILWENDGILPDQLVALMPAGRDAFAPSGETVVTHGGISIEEAIVPFIQVKKASS